MLDEDVRIQQSFFPDPDELIFSVNISLNSVKLNGGDDFSDWWKFVHQDQSVL